MDTTHAYSITRLSWNQYNIAEQVEQTLPRSACGLFAMEFLLTHFPRPVDTMTSPQIQQIEDWSPDKRQLVEKVRSAYNEIHSQNDHQQEGVDDNLRDGDIFAYYQNQNECRIDQQNKVELEVSITLFNYVFESQFIEEYLPPERSIVSEETQTIIANATQKLQTGQSYFFQYGLLFMGVIIHKDGSVDLFDPHGEFDKTIQGGGSSASDNQATIIHFSTLNNFLQTLYQNMNQRLLQSKDVTLMTNIILTPISPLRQKQVTLVQATGSSQHATSNSQNDKYLRPVHHTTSQNPATSSSSAQPTLPPTKPTKSFTPITMKDIYSIHSRRVHLVLRILAIVSSLLLITIPIIFGIMKLYNRHQEGKETQ